MSMRLVSMAVLDELAADHQWDSPGKGRFARLRAGGERIRTFGSAMRLHRGQRGRGVTPPDPSCEWRLLGPPPDNSIGMPRPATGRMTGAPVDRPQFGRTRKTVAYLARN